MASILCSPHCQDDTPPPTPQPREGENQSACPTAFNETSQKLHIPLSILFPLAKTETRGHILLQGRLGNVVFILGKLMLHKIHFTLEESKTRYGWTTGSPLLSILWYPWQLPPFPRHRPRPHFVSEFTERPGKSDTSKK